MVVVEAFSSTSELVLEVGKIGMWVQAVGLFVVIWIVIQLSNFFLNRKRLAILRKMESNFKRLEKKVDKLSKNK